MPAPHTPRRAFARPGALFLRAPAFALALGLGIGSTTYAQPAPVDSSTPPPSNRPDLRSQVAPIGSFLLHGREVGQPAYRGNAVLRSERGHVSLARNADGGAVETLQGEAVAIGRWSFPSSGPAGQAGERRWVTVNASRLNLRSGPGGNNEAKGQAPRGAKLLVVGQLGVWLEVLDRDGSRLWTHGGYVSEVRYTVSGAAEVELHADPRGPWAVTFAGASATRVERFEERVNEIVFVGMGDYASHEAWDLQSVQGAKVHGIFDSAEDDVIEAFGTRRDLNLEADVEGLLDDMGLQGESRAKTKEAIDFARRDAKDECANLAIAYWEAERGDRVLERMILSGHCVGSGVWGDNNGHLSFQVLPLLNAAFPHAASQLEDLMIAGCYSSSLRKVDTFRGYFPTLRSYWAYGGSAPGSWTGATIHNALWEEASRGSEPGQVSRVLARGTRKGDNVATWNEVLGYEGDGPLRELATIRAEAEASRAVFETYESGAEVVVDTQSGPMRAHYALVQEMLGHPRLSHSEQADWERDRDQTIRLIFYLTHIRVKFQAAYGAEVEAGFTALGLRAPDWSTMSRAEAKAAIASFKDTLDLTPAPGPEAQRAWYLLNEGLQNLSTDLIPNEWV